MQLLILLASLISIHSFASDRLPVPQPLPNQVVYDSAHDLDTQSYCRKAFPEDTMAVEMTKISIINDEKFLYITLHTTTDIFSGLSYKEYYLWIDIDPQTKRGYVPYFSTPNVDLDNLSRFRIDQYQAWTNFYADYRIFLSNKHLYGEEDDYQYVLQNCKQQDCSSLSRYIDAFDNNFDIDLYANTVSFKIPLAQLHLLPSQQIEIGATTYYEHSAYGNCHGEDDLPNWGTPAVRYTIK